MTQNQQPVFAEELEQTIASIFESMLGLTVTPVSSPGPEDTNRIAATVHFVGSWSAVILLEVSPATACLFAGRFLSMDTPESIDNDVRDVLGELANMIGGNLKSAVAPDATLSIPEVVDGPDFSLRLCGAGPVTRWAYEYEGGLFWISLIQSAQRS
jgi:chemotaxis protein CheX